MKRRTPSTSLNSLFILKLRLPMLNGTTTKNKWLKRMMKTSLSKINYRRLDLHAASHDLQWFPTLLIKLWLSKKRSQKMPQHVTNSPHCWNATMLLRHVSSNFIEQTRSKTGIAYTPSYKNFVPKLISLVRSKSQFCLLFLLKSLFCLILISSNNHGHKQ